MEFQSINIRRIMNVAVEENGVIVDVRSRQEFSRGHIPMAINVPLEKIEQGIMNLPKNRTYIVYCENGGASMMAAKLMTQKGYRIINTVGGLAQYPKELTREHGTSY